MAKTTIAPNDAWDLESKRCELHDRKLVYSRKLKAWFCKECLHASFLTQQAQQEATKRYRQSRKGRDAARRYEQSEGGKEARERYLKSAKYKARRSEYNKRLQESLRIARAVMGEKATATLGAAGRTGPAGDDTQETIGQVLSVTAASGEVIAVYLTMDV